MSVRYRYEELSCNSVLGHYGNLDTRLRTNYCFDPYINCEFNCVYCHAAVHKYDGFRDFSSSVCAKINAPQVLSRELSWLKRRGVVELSGNTDPYQPAEEKYRITQQVLEILKEHNWPFAIGTKSDLILRDLNLITEASEKSWCCVALTVTTLNRNLAKLLEPNAPSPKRRLEVVRRISGEGITVGVWLTPIIPYVTDSDENIAQVVEAAVESGAKFVLGGVLDMRSSVLFKRFLEEHFAQLVPRYEQLYKGRRTCPSCGDMDESYLYWVYKRFISLCQRYGVETFIPHFCTRKQALLFYIRNFSRFKGTPIFELTQSLNFLFPSKEFLQSIRIRFGDRDITRRFLKVLGYFPK